jgi:cytochrome c oxidase cbb3-type subunit 3
MSYAQEAANTTGAAPAPASSPNYVMYIIIALAFILLIAIAALSQVLIRLTMYVYENKNTLVKSVILLLMLTAGGHTLLAQDAATAPATAAATAAPASSGISSLEFIMGITVVLTEAIVIFLMLIRIWALINTIYPPKQAKQRMNVELPRWFDKFNESVAVEKEADIMLDHDYDGIKELDNQLPPWWKYGFLVTIVWAFGYLFYYHVMEAAPLSAGEYANEMEAAKLAKEAYMRTVKNNVDENTITFDKSYVDAGQKIFTENCVACHGSKGEGGVGPNLTDGFWIHGGKINDVFKTVKYGWPANGMKSWQADLSATQIAQVVCYVKSINGTNPPNPKAPQGEPYNEDGGTVKDSTATASAAVKDSTSK